MIGKFGASASFAIVFVYTAEMFPTEIRSTAVGASSLCGRIGRVTILMKTIFFMKLGSLQVEIIARTKLASSIWDHILIVIFLLLQLLMILPRKSMIA